MDKIPYGMNKPIFVCGFTITGRICKEGLHIFSPQAARFVVACNYSKETTQESLHVECLMIAPKGGHLPKELITAGRFITARGYRRASTWVENDGAICFQVDHIVEELEASVSRINV